MMRITVISLVILAFIYCLGCNVGHGDVEDKSDVEVNILTTSDDPYIRLEINPTGSDSITWKVGFYKNGRISTVMQMNQSGLNGLVVSFFDNGLVSKFGKVYYGKPVGVWYHFNPNDGSLMRVDTVSVQ